MTHPTIDETRAKQLRDDRATARRVAKQAMLKLLRAMTMVERKYLMEPGYESEWINPKAKSEETKTRIKRRYEKERKAEDVSAEDLSAVAREYGKLAPALVGATQEFVRLIEAEEALGKPSEGEVDLSGFMSGGAIAGGLASPNVKSGAPGYKSDLDARKTQAAIVRALGKS